VINAETDDVELVQTVERRDMLLVSRTKDDVIKMLETTLPYMLDNVVVTSNVTTEETP